MVMDGLTQEEASTVVEKVFCKCRAMHTHALLSLAVQRDRGFVTNDRGVLTVPSMNLATMLQLEKSLQKWLPNNAPQVRWFGYSATTMPLDCLEMNDHGEMVLRDDVPSGILQ